jgi:hypothetical protein
MVAFRTSRGRYEILRPMPCVDVFITMENFRFILWDFHFIIVLGEKANGVANERNTWLQFAFECTAREHGKGSVANYMRSSELRSLWHTPIFLLCGIFQKCLITSSRPS